jgi:hypothetical protein
MAARKPAAVPHMRAELDTKKCIVNPTLAVSVILGVYTGARPGPA